MANRRALLQSTLAAAASAWLHSALAQTTSDATATKIIVPYSAGGSTDAMARVLRDGVATQLNETVVVENQAGAGGQIGAAQVARSEPNGRTIFLGTIAQLAIRPLLYPKQQGNDPQKEFTPIILAARLPLAVVVPARSQFKTLKDLSASLRDPSGKNSYGSAGNGTSPHLAAEMYKSMAKVSALHVPYKGGQPALMGLVGGDTTFMIAIVPEVKELIAGGRLRALAVTTSSRVAELPDVPTAAEAGLPGYEISSWYGYCAPAGTPERIIDRLNAAFNAALKDEQVSKKLVAMGFQLAGGRPAELGQLMAAETERWAKVIKDANIQG